jgi:hypothetical protein
MRGPLIECSRRVLMEQTLLLNATYEPLRIVHWQKAITLWCQGKVEIVAHHDREIRSVTFSIKMPSVIRLLRRIRIRRTAASIAGTSWRRRS